MSTEATRFRIAQWLSASALIISNFIDNSAYGVTGTDIQNLQGISDDIILDSLVTNPITIALFATKYAGISMQAENVFNCCAGLNNSPTTAARDVLIAKLRTNIDTVVNNWN